MLYLELIKTQPKLLLLEKTILSMWKNVHQLTHMLQFPYRVFYTNFFLSAEASPEEEIDEPLLSSYLLHCFTILLLWKIWHSFQPATHSALWLDRLSHERSNATEIQTILQNTNTKFISVFYSDLLFLSWSCHLAARAERFCSHLLRAMLSHFL